MALNFSTVTVGGVADHIISETRNMKLTVNFAVTVQRSLPDGSTYRDTFLVRSSGGLAAECEKHLRSGDSVVVIGELRCDQRINSGAPFIFAHRVNKVSP